MEIRAMFDLPGAFASGANKETVELLGIAVHTDEKHRRTARKKLGLTNKESICIPTSIRCKR